MFTHLDHNTNSGVRTLYTLCLYFMAFLWSGFLSFPSFAHLCSASTVTFMTLINFQKIKQSGDSCSSRRSQIKGKSLLPWQLGLDCMWFTSTHQSAEKRFFLSGQASFYGYSIWIPYTFILHSSVGVSQNFKRQPQPNQSRNSESNSKPTIVCVSLWLEEKSSIRMEKKRI